MQKRAGYSPLQLSLEAGAAAGKPLLRLGSDLLHQHLLSELIAAEAFVEVLMAFRTLQDWEEQLAMGTLDAVLFCMVSTTAAAADACVHELPTPEAAGMEAIPLGSQNLQLLYAARHLRSSPLLNTWHQPLFLLPPASCQPLLDRQLRQQALMRVRNSGNCVAEELVRQLHQEPLLLPAHPSLLLCSPWLEAELIAVPPPDPIRDSLWLLVRTELAGTPQLMALEAHLRRQIVPADSCVD